MPESLIMVFMVVSILIGRGKGKFCGDGFVFERMFGVVFLLDSIGSNVTRSKPHQRSIFFSSVNS